MSKKYSEAVNFRLVTVYCFLVVKHGFLWLSAVINVNIVYDGL